MALSDLKPVKVLVVEDSPVVREFVAHLLDADPQIRVVGTASNGEEALAAVVSCQPDLVTMDINMPRMNGFEATRRIMEAHPTPIVIVSGSLDPREVNTVLMALEAGALAALPRPAGLGHPDHAQSAAELVQTVKLMAEVKVVRRRFGSGRTAPVRPAVQGPEITHAGNERPWQVVAMGASTGGPPALAAILSKLPEDFSIPILVVQHMAAGFIQGFAEWLRHVTGMTVQLAAKDERILPGRVHVAPDGFQMMIKTGGLISLGNGEAENGVRPSVSCLFRSVAEVCGSNAIGILLTGMGRDGAEELKLMKERGAITIAQDEQTSVVFGMPGEAVKLNAATHVLPPEQIACMLTSLAEKQNRG